MYEDIKDLKEDYIFPTSEHAPITRTMLALYAGASGDHNPIHIHSRVSDQNQKVFSPCKIIPKS